MIGGVEDEGERQVEHLGDLEGIVRRGLERRFDPADHGVNAKACGGVIGGKPAG